MKVLFKNGKILILFRSDVTTLVHIAQCGLPAPLATPLPVLIKEPNPIKLSNANKAIL